MEEQLAKLASIWIDENSELETDDYDKLYQGSLTELEKGNFQKALRYINQAIEIDDKMMLNDPAHFLHPEFYESKAKISDALRDPSGAKAALDRYEEISEQNKFRMNLSKKILVERLVIENHPFFGSFSWSFTPGVNILLGKKRLRQKLLTAFYNRIII